MCIRDSVLALEVGFVDGVAVGVAVAAGLLVGVEAGFPEAPGDNVGVAFALGSGLGLSTR